MNKEIISPVRKIKMNYRSPTGIFQSYKNGGKSIAFESMLERNMFVTLEFDKSVKSYVEQPIKINLQLKNRKTTYHPDCLVEYFDGSVKLIEVKYSSELESKKDLLEEKFEATREYAKSNGMQFGIFTEKDMDKDTLSNMLFLYKAAFYEIPEAISTKIKSIIEKEKSVTINALLDMIATTRQERLKTAPYLWKMLFVGEVIADSQLSELSMDSVLKVA